MKCFFVVVDLNVEFEVLCMGEDEERNVIYGPQCWYGVDTDPGGF